ncbi:isochorismatase family cysteine hydrolase [Mangrovicoccus ximenensis]|uniref:isochorismatase family cysteine hydrolase n=1 Tax=Mangrovicoccus ximenensis TaxID=1911570 RepID=UPI000D38E654|nr:isochorismatase family cysteine hydrolase [Mangrovicoccus ximenensis]
MSDPLAQGRNRPFTAGKTAVLVVDVQNETFNDSHAAQRPWFYEQARDRAIPNTARLIERARAHGIEVMYTVIESLTLDGRDQSLDYKLSGFNVPKGSWEAQVVEALAPEGDEIVLPKSSSSLFNSTVFEYVLRNIGIEQVIVTGFLTDQCVDQTLRDGADRGFLMVCATDACATESADRHDWALRLNAGYCRQMTTAEILAQIPPAA